MEVIKERIVDILLDLRSLCTHCGECCRDEFFFLTDTESPVLARKLLEKGGIQLIKEHILRNPTPYNVWGQFLFHYGESCPFHTSDRCSIYEERPITCRLFPFVLGGLFDNHNTDIRDPHFIVLTGKTRYACVDACGRIIRKMNQFSELGPAVFTVVSKIIPAALLDSGGFAYCFGQARARGQEFIDTAGMMFQNEVQVEAFLTEQFRKAQGVVVNDWVAHSVSLTDEEASRLASDLHARKAASKTSKRLQRVTALHPEIVNSRDEFRRGG